jgi:hypothetical protein
MFTLENIRARFQGAGLAPYNPEVILLKLDIQLRTLRYLHQALLPRRRKHRATLAR